MRESYYKSEKARLTTEADIRNWEKDSKVRIEEAKALGFVDGAKVRRKGDENGEIGEIIGHEEDDRAKVNAVQFADNKFYYRSDEIELVK